MPTERASSGAFDAVLMDIQMPEMDGLEATRRIRSWEAETGRRAMPIHVVSANFLPEHIEASRAAGADGHIPKPVSTARADISAKIVVPMPVRRRLSNRRVTPTMTCSPASG